jgi:hypothetical protein
VSACYRQGYTPQASMIIPALASLVCITTGVSAIVRKTGCTSWHQMPYICLSAFKLSASWRCSSAADQPLEPCLIDVFLSVSRSAMTKRPTPEPSLHVEPSPAFQYIWRNISAYPPESVEDVEKTLLQCRVGLFHLERSIAFVSGEVLDEMLHGLVG